MPFSGAHPKSVAASHRLQGDKSSPTGNCMDMEVYVRKHLHFHRLSNLRLRV